MSFSNLARCKKGFSLVEMMMAMFVLVFSILAMTSMTLASMRANLQNDLRNTATRLSGQMSSVLLAQRIDDITSGSLTPYNVANPALQPNPLHFPSPQQRVKARDYPFDVSWTATSMSFDLVEIVITVQYEYRGQIYSNQSVVYKHRAA